MMDEKEFDTRAAEALKRIETALQDENLDADLASGVLTVEFDDDSVFVINSHGAAKQIWMSANMQAWHFSWDGAQWKDTKSPAELFSLVAELVSEKLARTVAISTSRS